MGHETLFKLNFDIDNNKIIVKNGNSPVKQHIDTAQKTGACQLSKLGIKEFPEDLYQLAKNLRTLDLSENKLHGLPQQIGNFTSLKSLILNNNKLESLPAEIGNLKKLETLSLENNHITSVPSSLLFPADLSKLRQLDALNLSRNGITTIPESVSSCQAIEINLNQNQVSVLPESVAKCPRLKVLRLEENCLEISAFTPQIMKHSQIALLAIEGNVFDFKQFNNLDGYEEYMERFTATKKKFN
ncbi:Leucine-rich repeat-containing protein 57 [Mytilus edulis]|uniref:Leucine-rich repeat-containing protein 57 n=1 Tax=Mytilus edulis TaxID=6550 RepID=A0A8S3V6G1_MYTED|nr:Leucine-rich repeat-containing protein 57 [Mytilus edulis]